MLMYNIAYTSPLLINPCYIRDGLAMFIGHVTSPQPLCHVLPLTMENNLPLLSCYPVRIAGQSKADIATIRVAPAANTTGNQSFPS